MIALKHISWQPPGSGTRVLDDVSFGVATGRYAVLMGRTGSGKTTLLEILCGLRAPDSGEVWIGDREATSELPGERGIGYVPQDGALFPSMTIREQIGFGLKMRSLPAAEIIDRVKEAAQEVAVEHLLDRKPVGLSGGERQRVALARALVIRPSLLLLDEPLASLDEETQDDLLALLQRTQSAHRITVLHVTHSHREAERLGEIRLHLAGGRISDGANHP